MKPVVGRDFLTTILKEATPVDLRLVGRTLLHAAIVGVVAGLIGAAFFAGLEVVQRLILEQLAGYRILRASGETFLPEVDAGRPFRWWLLLFLPALGALGAGLVSQLAPETRGGGGDAMIDAFHRKDGFIRRRVPGVKLLASLFTLGTGGAGGREGPTMQIGGAVGSWVGRVLEVSAAERRILMISGVAAGIAAVFRTPLGAALLAVEVLYRDDFESDALIPAVLASVTAYSVVISIFGESTLFAHPGRFPFLIRHLWLYGLLAVLVTVVASVFVTSLRAVQRASDALKVPAWMKPAIGGAALGVFCVPIILFVGWRLAQPGQGVGLLGGGYGSVQVAITGASWLPGGWTGVGLLLFLCFAKVVASSLTIGSGGSAGDFAPALVIGGLFGGAFGRAAQILTGDPRIDAGAFALVAMGTFYGGVAHTPLSSLVLVCELAGSYDLLVPLMLAEGIAFVALRKKSLYHAQIASRRESPVHRTPTADLLREARVAQVMKPVSLSGLPEVPPDVRVSPNDDLRSATQTLLANKLRRVPVTDPDGRIVGMLDEADVSRYYLEATGRTPPPIAVEPPVAAS
ncbi:MAG TPA: chloride channel protein [Polyangia bacterium]|jgi:CIC family chloride channel protein|nr:chloride channel protein [Polyangia bacterium]